MSYSIGSFNIRIKNRDERGEADRDFFAFIHDFVVKEHIDILALQEVPNEDAMKRILRIMPSSQKWVGGYERTAIGKAGDCGFAFLWNSNRVSECSKDNMPGVFREYKSRKLDGYESKIRLSRDPLYGRFVPKISSNGEISQEIRLIDIHLRYKDEVFPNLEKMSGITKRTIELGIVTGEIYNRINVNHDGKFKPVFTVILGDYNLDVDYCNANSGNPEVLTYQREMTRLEGKGYTNSYDHFSYHNDNKEIPIEIKRIDAVNDYFCGDYEKYYQKVSDHVPVIIKIF